MKKLLIFDAYGTLISTGTGSLAAVKKILALQPQTVDAEQFYRDWKKYHRIGIDRCNDTNFVPEREIFINDLKQLYMQYHIDRPYGQDVEYMLSSLYGRKLFAETKEAIMRLREQYRVVIGSTTDTEPLLENLRSNGLQVDAVYTSEMIRKYKPATEFYQYILQQENCDACDAVFIGDSLKDDIYGPQAIGMTTVLIDRTQKFDQTKEQIKPDYVISDLSGLLRSE